MSGKVGVGVAALVFRGPDILLVQRQGAHGAGKWSCPGGWLEPNETIEDAACRELLEEVGLVCNSAPSLFGPQYTLDSHPEGINDLCYWVMMDSDPDLPSPQVMEPDKCSDARYFSPEEFHVMFDEGLLFLPLYNFGMDQFVNARARSLMMQGGE